jgi:UDP-GlcNAc:undecaprenyl-phosphate GlcNAc-1-phosphate transferase
MANLTNFIIAFLITAILLYELQPLAVRIRLVDCPNERKFHKGEIPLIGGISMFFGFILALFSLKQVIGLEPLIASAAILMIVGILDDIHNLSVSIRFLAQVVAALFMVFGGDIILQNLGAIGLQGSHIELGYLTALIFTVLAVIMAINSLNMCDGINGLAGGLTLITLSALAFIAWNANLLHSMNVLFILIATIVAFLRFNLRALVFMGDAGSMFLGVVVVWFLISFSQGEQRAMTAATALWIFALPLLDTGSMTIRRLLNGHSPFKPDRGHLHHLLLDAGFSGIQTLFIILSLAVSLAVVGIVGLYFEVAEVIMFWGFISLFFVYFGLVSWVSVKPKLV